MHRNSSGVRRRHLLGMSVGSAVVSAAPAWALTPITPGGVAPPPPAGAEPYARLRQSVPEDSHVVRLLFSYTCPYCRQYYPGLARWGATLPKPFHYEATPIVTDANDASTYVTTYIRYALVDQHPDKVADYDLVMFERFQGTGGKILAGKEIDVNVALEAAAAASGASVLEIGRYLQGTYSDADMARKVGYNAKVVRLYELKVTPSIGVAGKAVVTPDNASSDPGQLLVLLNGMVSRALQGGGDAI